MRPLITLSWLLIDQWSETTDQGSSRFRDLSVITFAHLPTLSFYPIYINKCTLLFLISLFSIFPSLPPYMLFFALLVFFLLLLFLCPLSSFSPLFPLTYFFSFISHFFPLFFFLIFFNSLSLPLSLLISSFSI